MAEKLFIKRLGFYVMSLSGLVILAALIHIILINHYSKNHIDNIKFEQALEIINPDGTKHYEILDNDYRYKLIDIKELKIE